VDGHLVFVYVLKYVPSVILASQYMATLTFICLLPVISREGIHMCPFSFGWNFVSNYICQIEFCPSDQASGRILLKHVMDKVVYRLLMGFLVKILWTEGKCAVDVSGVFPKEKCRIGKYFTSQQVKSAYLVFGFLYFILDHFFQKYPVHNSKKGLLWSCQVDLKMGSW
jgi:hypothetical protein